MAICQHLKVTSSSTKFWSQIKDTDSYSQWRIQDFPEGGREPSRGGVNTPNFPENCMKSKEFGRPGGGVRPSRPPLDPPMTAQHFQLFLHLLKVSNIIHVPTSITSKSLE